MEQHKKNKKAFISLGISLFFARMENGVLLLWKIFKNGTGGRGFFLILDPVFVWKNEAVEFKKINLENPALGSRLHACSAWDVNLKKAFVFAMNGSGFFLPHCKALTPHSTLSLFKLKVYFNFPHEKDASVPAQTTLYSYDFAHERLQTHQGGFNKALRAYNGYIYQVRYCHRLFLRNELYYARVFNNQSIDREELDYLNPENILVRMGELGLE